MSLPCHEFIFVFMKLFGKSGIKILNLPKFINMKILQKEMMVVYVLNLERETRSTYKKTIRISFNFGGSSIKYYKIKTYKRMLQKKFNILNI